MLQFQQAQHSGCCTKGLRVEVNMLVSEAKLLVGHINSNNRSLLADKLRENKAITPRAATEVQDAHSLHNVGIHKTTSIIRGKDFLMDESQGFSDVLGGLSFETN